MNATNITDTLGMPNPFNDLFKAKVQESNLKWATQVLALEGKKRDVNWSDLKGTKSIYFSEETQVWLQFISQMIYHLLNVITVIFHWSMVVACALLGLR